MEGGGLRPAKPDDRPARFDKEPFIFWRPKKATRNQWPYYLPPRGGCRMDWIGARQVTKQIASGKGRTTRNE